MKAIIKDVQTYSGGLEVTIHSSEFVERDIVDFLMAYRLAKEVEISIVQSPPARPEPPTAR